MIMYFLFLEYLHFCLNQIGDIFWDKSAFWIYPSNESSLVIFFILESLAILPILLILVQIRWLECGLFTRMNDLYVCCWLHSGQPLLLTLREENQQPNHSGSQMKPIQRYPDKSRFSAAHLSARSEWEPPTVCDFTQLGQLGLKSGPNGD